MKPEGTRVHEAAAPSDEEAARTAVRFWVSAVTTRGGGCWLCVPTRQTVANVRFCIEWGWPLQISLVHVAEENR
jgi:hypothetical protein